MVLMHMRRTAAAVTLVAFVSGGVAVAQDRSVAPVTDSMLENPDPADWLNWRRTLDGWGYSPLDQINRDNVHQLQLVWSWTMVPGLSQATPLVYDGVMYIPNPLNVVQALDALTGDLIWEYRKEFERSPDDSFRSRTRSIAIYDDKIYLNTNDAHIVALDAGSGEVVWDHTVADNTLGYRYTSGPIVVRGKVVAGMTGCERYKDGTCFISAHDAQTGAEVWRMSTIAQPGDPGGDSWGDLPTTFRAGGDAWIPGSYDPQTNTMYWSTSQAKPWARLSRGTEGDALYTNSALALDPETGRLCGITNSCRARHTTWTRCSRACSSTTTGGNRCSRWASSGSCGRSTARPVSSWRPTISVIRRWSTLTRQPGRRPTALA